MFHLIYHQELRRFAVVSIGPMEAIPAGYTDCGEFANHDQAQAEMMRRKLAAVLSTRITRKEGES